MKQSIKLLVVVMVCMMLFGACPSKTGDSGSSSGEGDSGESGDGAGQDSLPGEDAADGSGVGGGQSGDLDYILIDHTTIMDRTVSGCTDATCPPDSDVSNIPASWISTIKNNLKMQLAGRSHSTQIIIGMRDLANEDNPNLGEDDAYCALPATADAMDIYQGYGTSQPGNHSLANTEDYWRTGNYTEEVLDGDALPAGGCIGNTSINVSMFVWCRDLDYDAAHAEYVNIDDYLTAISGFEDTYAGLSGGKRYVTFVYVTGNADSDGAAGFRRYQNNQAIRNWVKSEGPYANDPNHHCQINRCVLFDFEDLDSWWYDSGAGGWVHHTYNYNGTDVPRTHAVAVSAAEYEFTHVTKDECKQKGIAAWYLLARIAGWES